MDTVTIRVMGDEPKKVAKLTTYLDVSKEYQDKFENPIVLAVANGELIELNREITRDCTIEFLDITSPNGFRTYQRSFVFSMIYAIKSILSKTTRVVVEHSLNKNYYCELPNDIDEITDEFLQKVTDKMIETAKNDIPLEKHSFVLEDAVNLTKQFDLEDRDNILNYRKTSRANFYKLDWYYDYFYGPLLPSTKYLSSFKLIKKAPGFIIQFPTSAKEGEFRELIALEKISQIFNESSKWGKILNVDTIASLNKHICQGSSGDIIRVAEALHEKKISQIADMVYDQKKKIVLVAGPSSSGKTTFANRLSTQLRVNGLKPVVISLDDYFQKNGSADYPMGDDGKPDFESLYALDIPQLNEDLTKLLAGEKVEIPFFNFTIDRREYKGRYVTLGKDNVLVLEGIHGLNEELTRSIPSENKFKVYISALTQLNIDDHNRIPTTDTRLIRRITRDYKFRNFGVENVLALWPGVQHGERISIFPYQEEADVMFNSALVYEMCILKQYAEPLLLSVPKTSKHYAEARRLVRYFGSFLAVSSEEVPKNSILREFVGGSCFYT